MNKALDMIVREFDARRDFERIGGSYRWGLLEGSPSRNILHNLYYAGNSVKHLARGAVEGWVLGAVVGLAAGDGYWQESAASLAVLGGSVDIFQYVIRGYAWPTIQTIVTDIRGIRSRPKTEKQD